MSGRADGDHRDSAADRRPRGVLALIAFFAFGVAMSALACTALLVPGGRLDAIWRINPQARDALASLGPWAIVLLSVVAIACGLSAIGLWTGARWSQRVAVSVLAVNVLGDVANAAVRGDLRTLIGLPIGGAMIGYLLSARVRRYLTTEAGRPHEHGPRGPAI